MRNEGLGSLDFLETKRTHWCFLSRTLLAWIVLKDFGGPSKLIKSLLLLSLTKFWWPIQTWLIWKHIVALETLSRHVLVTVLLKELDISLNLRNYHFFIDAKYSVRTYNIPWPTQNKRTLFEIDTLSQNYLSIVHCSWSVVPLTKKGAIIREK